MRVRLASFVNVLVIWYSGKAYGFARLQSRVRSVFELQFFFVKNSCWFGEIVVVLVALVHQLPFEQVLAGILVGRLCVVHMGCLEVNVFKTVHL
jgi:hypothetical protein